jgi:hypothetical protein
MERLISMCTFITVCEISYANLYPLWKFAEDWPHANETCSREIHAAFYRCPGKGFVCVYAN